MPDTGIQMKALKSDLSFGLLVEAREQNSPMRQCSVDQLKDYLRRHRLLVFRGFHGSFDATPEFVAYARAWGRIMTWPFGAVLDVIAHEEPVDSIFDRSHVPLHWDGMYRMTIPEIQLFYCVSAPDRHAGGRTTFVDTVSLLHEACDTLRNALDEASITCQVKKASHYGGEVHTPLITAHPVTGESTLRYYEPVDDHLFLNPHTVVLDGLDDEHHQQLLTMLRQPRYCYAHTWQPGDIVIADNFALLHGREAFDRETSRHLRRIHVHASPEHFNSALRFEAGSTHPTETLTRKA